MQDAGSDRQPPRQRRLAVSEVRSAIGRVRMRIRFGALLTACASGLLALVLVLAVIGLLDLSIGLGADARRVLAIALLVLVIAMLLRMLIRTLRVSERRAAAGLDRALLERGGGASGSEARSTLEFSEATGASDLLSRTFARRIAESAADRLGGFRASWVRTGYRSGRALAVCGLVLLVAGAAQIVAGDVVSSVGRRLIDPDGGHPRWSPIGVSIETQRVSPSASEADPGLWTGDSVRVSTVIEEIPEHVRALLMVQREGADPEPIPLDAVRRSEDPDEPYRASMTLRSVEQPVRVWVELRGGPDTPQRWRASSREVVLDPDRRPRLLASRLLVTPPAYTGIPPSAIDWPGRMATREQPVEFVQGARVQVMTRSSIAPTGLRGDVERPLVRLDPNGASIEWPQLAAGEHSTRLTLDGPDGRGDVLRLEMTVLPDEAPEAKIVWPERDEVVALAGAVVPLRLMASDDYGVDRATLDAEVVGDASRSLTSDLGGGTARIEADDAIDTGALSAVAGDTIEVRVRASDARPDELGGAQEAVSRVLTIRVVDPQQFAQMLREEVGEAAADAFEQQQSEGESGEPCPECASGECQGECQGGGNGSGTGQGSGSGSGAGQGSGSSGSTGSSGSSRSSGSSGGDAGSNSGGEDSGSQALPSSSPDEQASSGDGEGSEPAEARAGADSGEQPWQGDRFFAGRETEAGGDRESEASSDGQAPAEAAPGDAEQSPTGAGGNNDDGFRTRPDETTPSQPAAPPLAEDPDGRSGPGQSEGVPSELDEAAATVPERYRDLVRAYYERRSRSREGGQ